MTFPKLRFVLVALCLIAFVSPLSAQQTASPNNQYKLEVTYISNGRTGTATIDLRESRKSSIYLSGPSSENEGRVQIVALYSYQSQEDRQQQRSHLTVQMEKRINGDWKILDLINLNFDPGGTATVSVTDVKEGFVHIALTPAPTDQSHPAAD